MKKWLLAVLLLILIAGQLYLKIDAEDILAQVNSLLPGQISCSSIEISLVRRQVRMDDLVLSDPDGRPVIRAQHFKTQIWLMPLLRRSLVFDDMRLRDATVDIRRTADGRYNLLAAFSSGGSGGGFKTAIRDLKVRELDLTFSDGRRSLALLAPELELQLKLVPEIWLDFDLPMSRIILQQESVQLELERAALAGRLVGSSMHGLVLSVQRKSSEVTYRGDLLSLGPELQLLGQLSFDLETAEWRDDVAGRLSGQADLQGRWNNPQAELRLSYGGGKLMGQSVGASTMQAELRQRMLKIGQLQTRWADGEVGVVGELDLNDLKSIGYDLQLKGQGLDLDEIDALNYAARVDPQLRIQGRGLRPAEMAARFSFDLLVHAAERGEIVLNGSGSLQQQRLRLDVLQADLGLNRLTFSGSYGLADRVLAGDVAFGLPELEQLHAAVGGQLQGHARLEGALEDLRGEIDFAGYALVWQDYRLGDITLNGQLAGQRKLLVRNMQLNNRGSQIELQGLLGPQFDLTAQLKGVDPQHFAPKLALGGQLAGLVSLSGGPSGVDGKFDLSGSAMRLRGSAVGDLRLRAGMQQGLISFEELRLEHGSSKLSATGWLKLLDGLSLNRDPGFELKLQQGKLMLEDLSELAAGELAVNLELAGSLKSPSGEINLLGRDLLLDRQPIDELRAELRVADGRVWLEPFILAPLVAVDGWVDLDGPLQLNLIGEQVPLSSIAYLDELGEIGGQAALRVAAAGTVTNPQLKGEISLSQLVLPSGAFPDSRLGFELLDRKISFEGQLNLLLRGECDLNARRYRLLAEFDQSDLAPYLSLAGRPGLGGRLSGQLEAAGALGGLDALEARLHDFELRLGEQTIVSALQFAATLKDGVFELPQTSFSLAQAGYLSLSASGPLDENLRLDAQGVVPGYVVGALSEEVDDGQGRLQFKARASQGRINSELLLDDFGCLLAYNGQKVHSTNGRILVADSRVKVESLSGRLDRGRFSLGGQLGFERLELADIDLSGSLVDLPLIIPEMMDLLLDSELRLKGSADGSLLTADVTLLNGEYYKNLEFDLVSGVLGRVVPHARAVKVRESKPNQVLDKIGLNVRVRRRGEVKVDNNLAKLELHPDLQILGTLAKPQIIGRMRVLNGVVSFQGNEFDITHGVIDFEGSSGGRADIVAQTRVREWNVILELSGPLDDLRLELSSFPSEEQADIISLLVVGYTTREMAQSGSSMGISTSAMLAELLAGTYGDEIKNAVNLDIFEVKTNGLLAAEGESRVKLILGKELSRRLTVKYELDTDSDSSTQRGVAEYKILDNLLINAYQSSDGAYGADVQYRYEYR